MPLVLWRIRKAMARNAIPFADVSAMSEFKRTKALLQENTAKPLQENNLSRLSQIIPHGSHILVAISSLACIEKAPEVGTPDPILCALTASITDTANNVKQVHFFHQRQYTLLASRPRALHNAQLGTVTQAALPNRKATQVPSRKSNPNGYPYHVFKNGRWIKSGMNDHPVAYVSVSADEAWCRTNNAPHTTKMSSS